MRGWSFFIDGGCFSNWVLPAHAGVIPGLHDNTKFEDCITRTCGGDPHRFSFLWWENEYYPHMRGWSQQLVKILMQLKVLPAHAGVILYEYSQSCYTRRITRTCGGDPGRNSLTFSMNEYYPHMRGWSQPRTNGDPWQRVLPAHAGVIQVEIIEEF